MKNNQLHVVLGGSGVIWNAILHELKSQWFQTKAIERKKSVEGFETVHADLLNLDQALQAIEWATHVYLCVGLPYDTVIWLRDWPILMSNVIAACEKNQAKLIFLDNIYMYWPVPLTVPFDEKHDQNPQTKKGEARKITTDLMLKSIKEKKIQGVIGRSADFYGPGAKNSIPYVSFLDPMLKNKEPRLLTDPKILHTYAYVLDNAKALIMLALDETTHWEVWHLPVGKPITLEYILDTFNKELNNKFRATVIPKFMQKILGLFIKPLKETQEMLYQFEYPYIMSSEKFLRKFPEFTITPYEVGLKEMVKSFKKD